MGTYYEKITVIDTQIVEDLLQLLEDRKVLRKVENIRGLDPREKERVRAIEVPISYTVRTVDSFAGLKIEPEDNIPCSENPFIGNGKTQETNMESIAKEFLGIVEDRKLWEKDLKKAIKEYGHDEVLNAFYDWSTTQGVYLGKRPVSSFLKDITSYLAITKPSGVVTSPALNEVVQRIAYVSDNQVFFTGEFRVRLAVLVKDYGKELVIQAFEEFFQNVEPKSIPWAARDFIQRAVIMIEVNKQKVVEAAMQQATVANAYDLAKQNVEDVEEEEE